MMRIGIDTFTIRELKLDPFQTLDHIRGMGFEGAQFGGLRGLSKELDPGRLREISAYGEQQGMYTEVSVSAVNPVTYPGSFEAFKTGLEEEIRAAAATGWKELHSVINTGSERYTHPVPWREHVAGCIRLIRSLSPILKETGTRIDIETHGEATFDILQVIEAVGEDITGVCLDTANTLVNAEDPVLATRRVAPFTHLTHTKDGIVYFSEHGFKRQGRQPGGGVVDWPRVLPLLAEYSPDLPLSIEDHKWIFEARIFDPDWINRNPELTPYELGQVMKLVMETERKLTSGEYPPVDVYEAVPYMDEMDARLASGRIYLRSLLDSLGL